MSNTMRIDCPPKSQRRRKYRESSIRHRESLLTSLHLSRELYKSTLFLQNEPNFKNDQMNVSACNKVGYGNFQSLFRRKNEAKQSQFKPNFELKLGLFFQNKPNLTLFMTQYWLCFSTNFAVKWLTKYIKE